MNPLPIKNYSPDELNEALNVITRIGVVMLQSGSASFRAKETMERFAATLGAACAQAVRQTPFARRLNPYLMTALCSMVASFISYLLMVLTGASMLRVGLIASVLLLVPGVPLVTALLDLLHLDLISG